MKRMLTTLALAACFTTTVQAQSGRPAPDTLATVADTAKLQTPAARPHTKPGDTFTDFAMDDMEGRTRRLSDFVGQGKFVLLDFWASWCPPCRREIPHLRYAYNQFSDKGFEVVAVSLDTDREAWVATSEELGTTWPQLSDLKGWQNEAAKLYGIRSIPSTILFAPDGKVIAVGLRGPYLQYVLEKLLP